MRSLRSAFALGILLGYSATLAVSAGHLAQWYRMTLGDLPPSLALALAITLEANAFLLSLLSNYLLKESAWARVGALSALFLVWLGNYLSMARAASDMAWPEVFAASLFVPIGTYVMGKVLGELLKGSTPPSEAPQKQRQPSLPSGGAVQADEPLSQSELLAFLETPRTLQEVEEAFPNVPSSTLLEVLRGLRDAGRLRYRMGMWELIRNG